MFNLFKKSPKETFSYDQALLLTISFNGFDQFGTTADRDGITQLEKQIQEVLPENSGIDGHEFGDNECIIYIYGPSVDAIWNEVQPVLKKSDFDNIQATLQYGLAEDPKTKEKKFTI